MGNQASKNILYNKHKEEFKEGTPLIVACLYGRLDDVKVLREGEDLNELGTIDRRYRDVTPLMAAAKGGHLDVVEYLITNGANPNKTESNGMTALIYAVKFSYSNIDVIDFLLNHMTLASINQKSQFEPCTALDEALFKFNVNKTVVQLIRSYGGEANYFDVNGNNVGEGNGDLNADNLPSFQRETSMKF